MAEPEKEDFKYIVRLAETDLDGNDQVEVALSTIKGIGVRTAALLATRNGIPRYVKMGTLRDEEIEALARDIEHLSEIAPPWMVNRPKDFTTGQNLHVVGADLEAKKRDDINRLKKIQAYRGVRHGMGQKVRGQRTRSNGRSGLTVGVIKKKEGAQAPPEEGTEKRKKE